MACSFPGNPGLVDEEEMDLKMDLLNPLYLFGFQISDSFSFIVFHFGFIFFHFRFHC